MRVLRFVALACAFLLPGCVLPSGVDARTNGGLCDPGPDDPYATGQWGVTDHRAGSQRSWTIRLSGSPD